MDLRDYLKQERRPYQWVADACGVSRQAVFNWASFIIRPSEKNAEIIESMTDGKVTVKEILDADYITRNRRD